MPNQSRPEPAVSADEFGRRFARPAALLLSAGLFLALSQAFVPLDEFIQRADDAFYYFGVAANFPEEGFWTFDRVNETNGVQPLWALILSGIAEALSWVGVTDRDVLARSFVAVAAGLHFASSMLLFNLLRLQVSVGTGLIAAGAFLFPLGIVWARTWGMESSLYAFLLLASVSYFHLCFLRRPTARRAVALGALLGLAVLTRLNAGFLVPCVVGWLVLGPGARAIAGRWRLGAIVAGVAGVFPLAYFAINRAATGHLLPVSGTVKWIEAGRFLDAHRIRSRLSLDFIASVAGDYYEWLGWWVGSRLTDPLWIVGVRLASDEALWPPVVIALLLAFALLPTLIDRHGWVRLLRERYGRLLPFAYFLVFGLVDGLVSIAAYPFAIPIGIIGWWFVHNEIVIVVLTSTLVAASLGFLGERLVPARLRLPLATAAVAALVASSGAQTAAFYYDGDVDSRDWHLLFNGGEYAAAKWMEENLPHDALVGAWNAGTLGYYGNQRVVNLDGLINSYEIVPHLRERTIPEYISQEGIDYLSEVDGYISRTVPEVRERLRLRRVYSREHSFLPTPYVIYEVLGPRQGGP